MNAKNTKATSSRLDREIPKHQDLIDYNYAVAGHAGTMCDADGELFIKPCTQSEVDFYESARAKHPAFAELMPLFIGTLVLNEGADEAAIHAQIPDLVEHAQIPQPVKEEIQSHLHLEERQQIEKVDKPEKDNVTWVPNKTRKIATDMAVVLENAAFGYKRPNIMDAKLGVRLWADDAPLEKKKRFDKIASETTHKNHGFRVAGMRVYKGSEDQAQLDDEDYRIYDKDWGRLTVNDENVVDSIGQFIFNKSAGIDEDLGKVIAGAFAEDLRKVQEILENEESQMFSSSLLFIFEGDGEALRSAIQAKKDALNGVALAQEAESTANEKGRRSSPRIVEFSNPRIDSGIGMESEEMFKLEGATEINLSDLSDYDDSDTEISQLPEIYTLKLIDFAHAKWRPGQGPDENVLKGVRGLARIFEKLSE